MKKWKGCAAKTREQKQKTKIKLEQSAQSCSQNIYNTFNVSRRATPELESQVILTSPLMIMILSETVISLNRPVKTSALPVQKLK